MHVVNTCLHMFQCMCVFMYDTYISPILSDGVGPCMMRKSLPLILLTYNAGSKYSSGLFVCTCVYSCVLTLTDYVYTHTTNTHTHTNIHTEWGCMRYSQRSCQFHWCRTRRAGSTPPASAGAGWGSGGSGWTPWLAAFGCGNGLSPSRAAGWWLTHFQRYWRTSGLEERV